MQVRNISQTNNLSPFTIQNRSNNETAYQLVEILSHPVYDSLLILINVCAEKICLSISKWYLELHY